MSIGLVPCTTPMVLCVLCFYLDLRRFRSVVGETELNLGIRPPADTIVFFPPRAIISGRHGGTEKLECK